MIPEDSSFVASGQSGWLALLGEIAGQADATTLGGEGSVYGGSLVTSNGRIRDEALKPLPHPVRDVGRDSMLTGTDPGSGAIKVGTSGFSYPEWKGPFYPEKLSPQQMLEFYARHFAAVEINSTYYHIPSPRNMAAMAKRAEGRVEFAIKAHQDMTHSRDRYADALPLFREAIAPLREAGALGCVLVQFPFSFKATSANADFLRRIASDLAPDPVVVEFRHRSWTTEQTFDLLRSLGLAYCCVDEPRLPNLPPPVVRATAPIAYVRFHGRNRQKWWTHAEAWERYDYLYSEAELREWVPKIHALAEATRKCYAFFNNHARGQAVTNAQMLIGLLSSASVGSP